MGLWKKITKGVRHLGKVVNKELNRFDDFVNKDLGGWGNIAQGAGLIAAGVLTGGVATAMGAGTILGVGATTIGGLAGTGIAVGSVSSGAEQAKADRQAKKEASAAKAEANAANDLAERQRRASLISLRRQVGVRNVGGNTAIRGSSSTTTDTQKAMSGIVLG